MKLLISHCFLQIDFQLNLPLVQRPSSKVEDQPTEGPYDNRFMQVQAENEELERQQACLQAWTTLHTDLEQLQQLFIDFNKLVHVRNID